MPGSAMRRRTLVAMVACSVLSDAFVLLPGTVPTARSAVGSSRPSTAIAPVRRQQPRIVLQAGDFSGDVAYEQFLGELIFSSNEPAYDIAKNFDRSSDPEFRAWLKGKYEGCTDLEERAALRSLSEMIDAVLAKLEAAAADFEEEGGIADAEFSEVGQPAGAALSAPASGTPVMRSNDDIFDDMRNLQAGAGNQSPETAEEAAAEAARRKGSPWDSVPEAVRQSYEQVLKTIIDRPDSITLTDAVEAAYDKCDIQFLALLKEKMANASGDSKAQLVEVADEVNNAMQRRMSSATSKLQTILSAGNPIAIEAAAAKVARAGEADDALVLLLEANLQEAHKAGPQGAGAVRVLTNVKNILQAEIDRKLEPEKRLLKQCLRCDTAEEMETVLHEAFRPRVKLQLAENKESSDEPLVAPPAFIAAVRNLKLNFGNVGEDETEFADKVEVIISTAEKVATALYGESMSPKDQQDRAWREHGASVWDLEKLENDAMLRGEEMPWANDKYDTMLPNLNKGDKSGEFKIGGS